MIHIYHHHFTQLPSPAIFGQMLKNLPQNLHPEICKYIQPIDRYTHLVGKLMLLAQLAHFRLGKEALAELQTTEFGKPFLEQDIHFSISHSHQLVACAISQKHNWLGIDIEHSQENNYNLFRDCFSPTEWAVIQSAENIKKQFYQFWSQKEAFMKADGRGMSLPPAQIELNENIASDKHDKTKIGFLYDLSLNTDYSSWLCTDTKKPDLVIEKWRF